MERTLDAKYQTNSRAKNLFFSWKWGLQIIHLFLDSANFNLLSEVKIVRMDERTNVWALITWLAQIDAKSEWIQYFLLKNALSCFRIIDSIK